MIFLSFSFFFFWQKPNDALNFSAFAKLTPRSDSGKANNHGGKVIYDHSPPHYCMLILLYAWSKPGSGEKSSRGSLSREGNKISHNKYHSNDNPFLYDPSHSWWANFILLLCLSALKNTWPQNKWSFLSSGKLMGISYYNWCLFSSNKSYWYLCAPYPESNKNKKYVKLICWIKVVTKEHRRTCPLNLPPVR